jgi:hypothetical protein
VHRTLDLFEAPDRFIAFFEPLRGSARWIAL